MKSFHVKDLPKVRINFMVAGVGGMGKSTFLRLLFKLYNPKVTKAIEKQLVPTHYKTVKIETVGSFELRSGNVIFVFTLWDAPGFGDGIDNVSAINNIENEVIRRHNSWLNMDHRSKTTEANVSYRFDIVMGWCKLRFVVVFF